MRMSAIKGRARWEDVSLLERYVRHAQLHDCFVSFDSTHRDAGSVSLSRRLGSQKWHFCELPTGELLQIISTRANAIRRHRLLSGEYCAMHLVLRGRLSYARLGERSPHTAIGPSGMIVNHGRTDDISIVIQPGALEVLTFFYHSRRMTRIIQNSPALQRFMAGGSNASTTGEQQYSGLFPIDLHVFSDLIAELRRSARPDFGARQRLDFERLSIVLLETFLIYVENLFKLTTPGEPLRNPSTQVLAANELALNPPRGLLRTKEAARHLAMSESKFKAFYKAETGQSYQQFRIQARQNKAKLLLHNSNLPIEQIAELLGYSHLSSFCRCFKRIEGTTPSEVRRRLRRQIHGRKKA
jgi:AraC-like DNA-binding protein